MKKRILKLKMYNIRILNENAKKKHYTSTIDTRL
jgi:hypothetical protein